MPRYTLQDPDTGRKITVEGDSPPSEQEAEQLFGSSKQSTAPSQPKKTFAQRFKEAVMVPEDQRKALAKERQAAGSEPVTGLNWSDIKAVPSEIGKEFIGSAKRLGADFASMASTDPGNLLKYYAPSPVLIPQGQLEAAGDLAGTVFSPATGAANALVGRPIEAATGIRREIPGAITSSLIPIGGEAKAGNTLRELSAGQKAMLDADKVLQARKAGYVLPPHEYSSATLGDAAIAGAGGKIKIQQKASTVNQQVTNRIAAQDVGIPTNKDLTPEVLQAEKKNAGKAYDAVKKVDTKVIADDDFLNDLVRISESDTAAAQAFPELHKNPHVDLVVDALQNGLTTPKSTEAIVDEIRNLRDLATSHFKGPPSTDNIALGFAKRRAADALEELLDRNLSRDGKADLVSQMRAARQRLAKLHDLESVTDESGDVNASHLARLLDRGRPLTGGLKLIAETADAFPKVVQMPKRFGGDEKFSALDFWAAVFTASHNPKLALAIAARPISRSVALSGPMQNRLAAGHGMNLLRDFAQSAPKTRNYLLGVSERTSPLRRSPRPILPNIAQQPDEQ